LKQAGLVRDRHEGRQTHYSAQLGALAPWVLALKSCAVTATEVLRRLLTVIGYRLTCWPKDAATKVLFLPSELTGNGV
jgi:hypothetical protein